MSTKSFMIYTQPDARENITTPADTNIKSRELKRRPPKINGA
jgi:hypothetical protein